MGLKQILASDLTVEVTTSPAVKPESADNLPFGAVFTDHMLEIDWTAENGWGTPEIKPFQNLSLVSIDSVYQRALF
jgi:branched-chain amino acid aminotransferase